MRELPLLTDWKRASESATHYLLGISDIAHRARSRSLARKAGLRPAAAFISS
jgi:hypothetical protein